MDYKECFNLTSADLMANVTAGSSNSDYNGFYRGLWESQYHAYNHGAGFIFWNWFVSVGSWKARTVSLTIRRAAKESDLACLVV